MKIIGTLLALAALALFMMGTYIAIMYTDGWPPEKCLLVGISSLAASSFFYPRKDG